MNIEQLEQNYPFIKGIKEKEKLPEGWKKRFLIPMLDDLKEVLERNRTEDSFSIINMSSLNGKLVCRFEGAPLEWEFHQKAWDYIAERTCEACGEFPSPQRKVNQKSEDKLRPLCRDCLSRENNFGKDKEYLCYLDYPGTVICDYSDDRDFLESNGKPEETLHVFIKDMNNEYHSEDIDMKPFYVKIGYRYEENNKYIDIRKMPKDIYDRYAEDIVSNAESLWNKYGEPSFRKLPASDNNQVKNTNYLYRKYIRSVYGDSKEYDVELLPIWYTSPCDQLELYDLDRKPKSGLYEERYQEYLDSLSLKERIRHRHKYPRPLFMDEAFLDADENETIVFTYRNRKNGKEKTVEARYYCFSDLNEEEQKKEIEEKRRGMASFAKGHRMAFCGQTEKEKQKESFEKTSARIYRYHLNKWEFVRWNRKEKQVNGLSNQKPF